MSPIAAAVGTREHVCTDCDGYDQQVCVLQPVPGGDGNGKECQNPSVFGRN